jgi:hypothetical protein
MKYWAGLNNVVDQEALRLGAEALVDVAMAAHESNPLASILALFGDGTSSSNPDETGDNDVTDTGLSEALPDLVLGRLKFMSLVCSCCWLAVSQFVCFGGCFVPRTSSVCFATTMTCLKLEPVTLAVGDVSLSLLH